MSDTATADKAGGGDAQTLNFQAEVSRLLDIVAHSLYSEREVFLRELISNASDACDKLRYEAIHEPELIAEDPDFRIDLTVDEAAGTLTVGDNGVGMSRDDLVTSLGTIAKSGTADFASKLKEAEQSGEPMSLIGQFGVGFYAAFMVADKVEVRTRRAGEHHGWLWTSDGRGSFTIAEADKAKRGTDVTLYLKEDAREFLERIRLENIVQRYSDHIALPIYFGKAGEAAEESPINRASALWTRPKAQITEDEYKEFYHHVAHGFDEPWLTLHWRAEGVIEYTGLLFIPKMRPFNLFDPSRRHEVKLYVRRVFITDNAEGLLPPWLRFLRGVIDSEDLPLNVSREMLQNNPVLSKIKRGIVNKVLGELKRKGDDEDYPQFWENFGAVLKEGLYEDHEHREAIFKLCRFKSTESDGRVSLDDYIGRMKEGQNAIFFIAGEDIDTLRKSPQLEGFRKKGVEVLLLADPIDEFWPQSAGEYEGKPFKSVTRGGADLKDIAGKAEDIPDAEKGEAEKKSDETKLSTFIALLKTQLGESVKDVRISERLTESPVCLVADEGDIDIHLEKLLKQHKQLDQSFSRILEINPDHPLIQGLADRAAQGGAAAELEDASYLLLDQARIIEGETLPDPAAFSQRLAKAMQRGLLG
mgnify:CR=1 FL=1